MKEKAEPVTVCISNGEFAVLYIVGIHSRQDSGYGSNQAIAERGGI